MIKRGDLDEYRTKRDLRKTPEPSGRAPRRRKKRAPIFVIQKHQATNLHYDFRLEVDGVLKSWAVPKGPSTNPKDKRLAVHVEDHPLDYADFEGNIPKHEYGGGTVIVWDRGTYHNLRLNADGSEIPMGEALDEGRVEIWLEGKKLRGGYLLVRARMRGEEKNWLLMKKKDGFADARRKPTKTQPRSVLTDRTLEEVAADDS